jgi:hypothetical protein
MVMGEWGLGKLRDWLGGKLLDEKKFRVFALFPRSGAFDLLFPLQRYYPGGWPWRSEAKRRFLIRCISVALIRLLNHYKTCLL